MAVDPRPRASSVPAQPPRKDALRAIVDLASQDAPGPPELFLLPDGPRAAAAVARGESAGAGRAANAPVGGLLAAVAVVAWVFLSVPFVLAAGAAAALLPAVFVAVAWAAAHALVGARAAGRSAARGRGHCVELSRDDSKRIARRAAAAAAGLLRGPGDGHDAAFDRYHQSLVSLARYELAAERALAAERDRSRLGPDDPLRSVAGQIAQDRAADAVAHRAAARREADALVTALRSAREQDGATGPRETD